MWSVIVTYDEIVIVQESGCGSQEDTRQKCGRKPNREIFSKNYLQRRSLQVKKLHILSYDTMAAPP